MDHQPVAIVTGAGRGIGRAAAGGLGRAGYRLALIARTASDLEETTRIAGQAEAMRLALDISQAEQVSTAVEQVMARFGRVDVLVNNAGTAPLLPVEETTPAVWREVIETNLSAAFYFCHALWPIFRRQGGGVVVLVSSESARDPFPGFAAYGAAKAGLNLLGKSLAKEGANIGVRVHTVAPAAVETGMFRALMTPEQYSADKTLTPAEVARVIMQCVSGDLANTSGEVIYLHKTVG